MKIIKAILKKLKEPTAAVATVAAILLILSVGGVFACIFLSAPHAVAYVLYGVSALFVLFYLRRRLRLVQNTFALLRMGGKAPSCAQIYR